jgi:GTPase
MAFIDEVKLHIKAGKGGDGVVRWRQEKYKPKSGPGGGNGGNGGDVYIEAVSDLSYLDYYLHAKKFQAENGDPGGNNSREGKSGEDLILFFPRGTVLKNLETGEECELKKVGERLLLLKGGRGGLGNEHFKSSTNTTPYEWTPGKPGQEGSFFVELRLFADVGFVGLPSAGKSTLLNALTNAKSKVGAYHFTTLEPHLGDMHGYILADIPGLIEGASEGRGLGHRFLKHIRRTKALVHIVALDSEHPFEDYQTVRNELLQYDPELSEKQEIILLSKTDVLEDIKEVTSLKKLFSDKTGNLVYTMTAYDDESIKVFKNNLIHFLESQQKPE